MTNVNGQLTEKNQKTPVPVPLNAAGVSTVPTLTNLTTVTSLSVDSDVKKGVRVGHGPVGTNNMTHILFEVVRKTTTSTSFGTRGIDLPQGHEILAQGNDNGSWSVSLTAEYQAA